MTVSIEGAQGFWLTSPDALSELPSSKTGANGRRPHRLYWSLGLATTMARVVGLAGAVVLVFLTLSSLAAAPANAVSVAPPFALASEPVWATVNAAAKGNYPGGNEAFYIFVVDSSQVPNGNVTIQNMTLSTTAWTGGNSNFGTGFPTTMTPGQSLLSTIYLPIPSDFSQNNFTANLVVNVILWNGTVNLPLKLTGSAQVFMLELPGHSGSQSGTTITSTTTVTGPGGSAGGTISTTLFAVGVAIPSIVVVLLLVLLARARGRRGP